MRAPAPHPTAAAPFFLDTLVFVLAVRTYPNDPRFPDPWMPGVVAKWDVNDEYHRMMAERLCKALNDLTAAVKIRDMVAPHEVRT